MIRENKLRPNGVVDEHSVKLCKQCREFRGVAQHHTHDFVCAVYVSLSLSVSRCVYMCMYVYMCVSGQRLRQKQK